MSANRKQKSIEMRENSLIRPIGIDESEIVEGRVGQVGKKRDTAWEVENRRGTEVGNPFHEVRVANAWPRI
jgi:hypothetical protein